MTTPADPAANGTVNRPIRFGGHADIGRTNRLTHRFVVGRCAVCDARPSHAAAEYRCGTKVPREIVAVGTGVVLASDHNPTVPSVTEYQESHR